MGPPSPSANIACGEGLEMGTGFLGKITQHWQSQPWSRLRRAGLLEGDYDSGDTAD